LRAESSLKNIAKLRNDGLRVSDLDRRIKC